MKKIEENKYSMFKSVYGVLNENKSSFSEIPALSHSFGVFEKELNEISSLAEKYSGTAKGRSLEKENIQEELIDSLLKVGGILYIAGRNKKDENLKTLSSVTHSSLKRLRDNEVLLKAETICQNAKNYADFLKSLHAGIDSEIAELEAKIASYDSAITQKDTRSAESHAAREELDAAFDNADEVLTEELDTLMETIRTKNPDLYNRYKSARVIKDLGTRKEKDTMS